MNQQRHAHVNAAENTDSLQGMTRMALNILLWIFGMNCAGPEIAIRHRQGSRYQNIFVIAFAQALTFIFIGADLTIGKKLGHGLIGMGTIGLAVNALFWWHWFRVITLIAHPDREAYSYSDGKPFGFWKQFPKGDKWPMVRMVWEPLLILSVAVMGRMLHLLTPIAALYLTLAAVSLSGKSVLLFYLAWEYIRDLYDGIGRSMMLVGGGKQGAVEAIKRAIASAARSIPLSLPPAAVAAVEETLPSELQALLSKPEPEKETQVNFDWLTPPSPVSN